MQGALPTTAIDQPTSARLQSVLDDIVAGGEPDAIAAVITPDGTWAGAAGVDGPGGRAATAHDEFAIASISKTFTAALVMHLAEQGKINLDRPLASYLQGADANANNATVRQALAMRGGFGDTAPTVFDEVYADPTRAWTTAEVVSKIGPPLTPAGTEFHYSNPGYKLLGLAAEQVTGKSISTAMRDALLDPVHADGIVMQDPDHLTPQPWALPLKNFEGPLALTSYGKGSALPCMSDATFSRNAAGMASDAASLARWGWLLFSNQILQPQSLATMMTFDSDGHGIGVDKIPEYGPAAYGFSGSKPGYHSVLAVLPERNTVMVMFINNADSDELTAGGKLLDALQGTQPTSAGSESAGALAARGDQSALDGVLRFAVDERELLDGGASASDAKGNAGVWQMQVKDGAAEVTHPGGPPGSWTFTFDGPGVALDFGTDGGALVGTYAIDGDNVRFRWDVHAGDPNPWIPKVLFAKAVRLKG
ncbi:MAG: serine hydrolase domain-containing protein [Mycobacteriales bacterium]